MLFIAPETEETNQKDCFYRVSSNENKKKSISLRAQNQVSDQYMPKITRAFCAASCRGSMTVETAAVFPFFLCALVTILMIGQMLIAEAEIRHSVSATAAVCARQEAIRQIYEKNYSAAGKFLETGVIFRSLFQISDLCENCIVGGHNGVIIRCEKAEGTEDSICVSARYQLRVPVPFFQRIRISRKLENVRRIYTGYVMHGGEVSADENDTVVYVAEHGDVYHTSMTCSHICLRFEHSSGVEKMMKERGLRPCEKCVKNGKTEGVIYITVEGDCYHENLACSGLKRTIRTVKKSEIAGMRMCERCALRDGIKKE